MRQPAEEPLPPDQQSWAFRVRAGDVAALEEAFHNCYADMCSFVQAQVGSADAAEDLVQDVFVRLWQTRHALDPQGNLRNYLYRSAHNAALNHLKHQRVEDRWERSAPRFASSSPNSNDPAAYREVSAAVDRALAALPDRCRLVFTLSRHAGLSYNEIALTLGISVKTVETQMGRALKSLRSSLAAFLP